MTVNDDFEMLRKDVVFSSFETLFPHLPGKPEACPKGISIGRPRSHVPVFDRPAASNYRRTKWWKTGKDRRIHTTRSFGRPAAG